MRKRIWLLMVFLGAMAVVAGGCGKDSGDSAAPCAAPTVSSVSGLWHIAETSGNNTCGDPVGVRNAFSATLTQSGSAVTESSGYMSGQLCGNTLTLSGSFPEGAGTTSETITVTVNPSATSFSGSSSWSWKSASTTCTGSSSYTAQK